jgi:hypothetical protein
METTVQGIPKLTANWSADNTYSITFSIDSRLINGLFGAPVPFQDVVHSDTGVETHYLGTITQEMYQLIVESINNPHCLAFWMADQTLKIRRLTVNLGPGTYLDNARNALVGLNNTVTLIPQCVDNHGTVWSDVQIIDIKNMEKKNFAISINEQDSAQYKTTSTNNQPVTFRMMDKGRATLRFKVVIPELTTLWLSVYPELYAYDQANLDKFTAWAATQTKQ